MYSLDFTQYNNITQSDYDAAITAQTREFRNRVSFGYWSGTPRTFTPVVQFTAGIRSLSVNQVVNSDSKLTMGNACSSALKLDFFKPDTNENLSNKVVRIESGLQVGGQIVYVPVGYFNIAEFTSEDDYRTIQITGYDDMERLSEKWTPGQTTPTTAKDVVDGIAARRSVSVEYSTAAGTALSGKSLSAAQLALLTSYTEREVLGLMAGLGGANAFFDARGVLCVKWFTASGVTVPLTLQWQGGLKKTQNEPFTIASVTSGVDDQVHTAGTGKGLTFVNPLITQAEVQTIYNDVNGAQFLPCEVLWRGNPLVGCGDTVTVYDKHNNVNTVYVAGQEIDLTGGFSQKIICPTADGEINFQTADERTALAINLAKTDLQQAIAAATAKIIGANGGYFTTLDTDNDGNIDTLLVSENPVDPAHPENTLGEVLRINKNGIGLSSTGYNGPFQSAITGSGINADAITAGQMAADRLSIGTPAKINNLVLNGTFCVHGGTSPHQTSRFWAYDTNAFGSVSFDGSSCLCHIGSTGFSTGWRTIYYDKFLEAKPNTYYTIAFDGLCSANYSSVPVNINIVFYDSEERELTRFSTGNDDDVENRYPTHEWKTYVNTIPSPANTAYFKVELWLHHTNNGNANEIAFRNIVVNEGVTYCGADDLLNPASGKVSVNGKGVNIYQGEFNIYDANGTKRVYLGHDADFSLNDSAGNNVIGFGTLGDLLLKGGGRYRIVFAPGNYSEGTSDATFCSSSVYSGEVDIDSYNAHQAPKLFKNAMPYFEFHCNETTHEGSLYIEETTTLVSPVGFYSESGNDYAATVFGQYVGKRGFFEKISSQSYINTSGADSKTNITPAASMLAKILSADIYNYDYVSEVEEPAETEEPELILNGEGETIDAEPATPQHYGLVIGDGYNTPEEVISKDGKGVDLYSMISIAWKAIQEQQAQIAALEQRIAALEGNE